VEERYTDSYLLFRGRNEKYPAPFQRSNRILCYKEQKKWDYRNAIIHAKGLRRTIKLFGGGGRGSKREKFLDKKPTASIASVVF
jgi:hypothetical protein